MHALHLDWGSEHLVGTAISDGQPQKQVDVDSLMQSCGLCQAQFQVVKYPEHLLVCPALVQRQLDFAFTQSA
ncbi:MAG: hypothetical protein PHG25_03150 [Candidatus Pacebacteria bacterium]|nr:hypothetical protein [Candidatus Paceibacterota bacterium]